MPVIGRLDDQVEAVLINPRRRVRAPDEERPEQPETHAPATVERDAESSPESRPDDDELPVWLL